MTPETLASPGPPPAGPPLSRARLAMAVVLPIVLLGIVLALVMVFQPAERLRDPAAPPPEYMSVQRVQFRPEGIIATVINESPQDVTIAQVTVDDAYWQFTAKPGLVVPPLRTVTVTIPYPWVAGEAHVIGLLSSIGTKFTYEVPVALQTPQPDGRHLGTFTLIGLFVGVIPVALGLLWFPVLRSLGRTAIDVMLAFTVGLLVFLVLDSLGEGLEAARMLPGALQGGALFILSGAAAYSALEIVGGRLARRRAELRASGGHGWTLALMIAVGIGLHNFAEGLAIGSAFALGEAAFGTRLIVGFTLHNLTEGLAIISPLAKENPGVRGLLKLGLIAGVPTILGAWVGGLVYSLPVAVVFLGLGAGAIAQVVVQILSQIRGPYRLQERLVHAPIALGLLAGFAVMYATGVLTV